MNRFAYWGIAGGVALLGLVAGLWHVSNARDFQVFGTVVSRVDTERRLVALTFDDGPTTSHTAEILALLAEHDLRATFFLTGRAMADQPGLTRAIVAAGHQVGNHSWSHPRMLLMGYSRVADEIERTDAGIRAAGYDGEILFRPPLWQEAVGTALVSVAP